MDNLSTRICLECGKALLGRSDKRFCDAYCRNTYNNRNKSRLEHKIQITNATLRRNRRILHTLCPEGKATVRREVLEKMGFSFRHFSSLFGSCEKCYFLCFDYAYQPIWERSVTQGEQTPKVLIVQYQEFMRDFDPWKFTGP